MRVIRSKNPTHLKFYYTRKREYGVQQNTDVKKSLNTRNTRTRENTFLLLYYKHIYPHPNYTYNTLKIYYNNI